MSSLFDISPGPAVGLIVVGLVVIAVAMGAKFTGTFTFAPNLSTATKTGLALAGGGLALLGIVSLVAGSDVGGGETVASPTKDDSGDDNDQESTTTSEPTTTTAESTTTTNESTTTTDESTTTTSTTQPTDERSCLFDPINTGDIAGSAFITSLEDGQAGGEDLNGPILGTEIDVPDDIDIWIVNSPKRSEVIYPQSHNEEADPASRTDGRFASASYMTTSSPHEVAVLLAEPAASQELRKTLLEWMSTDNYPGMRRDELPAGLVEVDCITLVFEAP